MKNKLHKFLNAMCGACLGILGLLELDISSLFFFGEPKFPEKPEE